MVIGLGLAVATLRQALSFVDLKPSPQQAAWQDVLDTLSVAELLYEHDGTAR